MTNIVTAWNHSGLAKFWMFMIVWDIFFAVFDFSSGTGLGIALGAFMLFLLGIAIFMLHWTLRI